MVDEVVPVEIHQASDGQPSPGDGNDIEVWVTLSEAVRATGVADKTLRRWLSKGEVQGREVSHQFGVQWTVLLSEVKDLAVQKGIGHLRAKAAAPDMSTQGQGSDQGPVQDSPPGQMLVPRAEWERAVTQMANIADLAAELGEAKEAKGRAEAKVETMSERLKSVRDERDSAKARVEELEGQAKERLEAELAAAKRKRGWFRRKG